MLGMISLTAVGNVRTLIAASAEGNGLGYVEEYQPPPAGGTVLEWGGPVAEGRSLELIF